MSTEVVLIGGARTPFGKFGGELRDVPSVELGAFAMRAALERSGVPAADVDEVYYGATIPSEAALDGSIPGRVAMLNAGVPEDRLQLTIDRACCSAMTAAHLAARSIRAGEAAVVLAGGADNMGRAPFLMTPEIRWGIRRGGPTLTDPMAAPGADIGGKPVAVDAGEVATEHGITREQADRWAVRSHRDYFRAKAEGFFDDEVVPYRWSNGRGPMELTEDENPRPDSSEEKLARLRTAFDGPLVTAGNAPGQDAGGCFVVLASRRYAEEHALEPLAVLRSMASIARAPREIAVAPAPALERALAGGRWGLDDMERLEVNEAFACVPLTVARLLAGGDAEAEERILTKLNVNGGAVAMGHPPGASGARLLLTLARELRRRGGGRGAAAICGGLGQADATVIEVS